LVWRLRRGRRWFRGLGRVNGEILLVAGAGGGGQGRPLEFLGMVPPFMVVNGGAIMYHKGGEIKAAMAV